MQYESTRLKPSTPDLTHQSFERLVVIQFAGYHVCPNGSRHAYWTCQCSCGAIKDVSAGSLKSGNTRSCGCLRIQITKQRATLHGKKHTAEYRTWCHMLGRCENSNDKAYINYGGRGITICQQWHDFATFYADVGPRPSPAHTLDRYPNNDGNYEPRNVRWATALEQSNNKRNNRLATLDNLTQSMAAWSRTTGLDDSTIVERLNRGWSDERALTTPLPHDRTHCKYGHALSGANLHMQKQSNGSFRRICRRCRNDRTLAFQKRHAKRTA